MTYKDCYLYVSRSTIYLFTQCFYTRQGQDKELNVEGVTEYTHACSAHNTTTRMISNRGSDFLTFMIAKFQSKKGRSCCTCIIMNEICSINNVWRRENVATAK